MTYLAIIKRTLGYALIAALFYHLIPAWRYNGFATDVLIVVGGCWLVDMGICLVSRVNR